MLIGYVLNCPWSSLANFFDRGIQNVRVKKHCMPQGSVIANIRLEHGTMHLNLIYRFFVEKSYSMIRLADQGNNEQIEIIRHLEKEHRLLPMTTAVYYVFRRLS
jgi:hypothetical protein